jgi:hypothetical protein
MVMYILKTQTLFVMSCVVWHDKLRGDNQKRSFLFQFSAVFI